MIVYGDHVRTERPGLKLIGIGALVRQAADRSPGAARHDALVEALIEAGELAQGLADAEMRAAGRDLSSPLQRAAMALVLALAHRVGASWTAAFDHGAQSVDTEVLALAALSLPDKIDVKQPEGYGFYALYPEAYFIAGTSLLPGSVVIGLRSIGTSLAAMVAAGAGSTKVTSLRPVGHPFRRGYSLDPDLLAELVHDRTARVALVDEGPGLSGSSLGALADLIEAEGVRPERITFLPGHTGALGREALPRHARRWAGADRRVTGFEESILPRVLAAATELTGPASAPADDLSGGAWRTRLYANEADWPPVHAMQERRKFLLRTGSGPWLLKFAGLGRVGRAALEEARWLHAAGVGPEPLGLRLGFLIVRWEDGAVPLRPGEGAGHLAGLGRYLGLRADLAAGPGADLATLAEMAACNIAESLGEVTAQAWRHGPGRLDRLPAPRPVRTDNRLHGWEWLRRPDGALIKTDATDHHRGHDLVGSQDIAWDVAGACVEFGLSIDEVGGLEAAGAFRVDRVLLGWMVPVYLAFQIGLWTMAAQSAGGNEAGRIEALIERYRDTLRDCLAMDGV